MSESTSYRTSRRQSFPSTDLIDCFMSDSSCRQVTDRNGSMLGVANTSFDGNSDYPVISQLELSEIRCCRWYFFPARKWLQAFQPDKAESDAGKTTNLRCVYSDPRVTQPWFPPAAGHGPRPGPADQRQPRVSIGKPGERFQQDGHPFRDAQAADVDHAKAGFGEAAGSGLEPRFDGQHSPAELGSRHSFGQERLPRVFRVHPDDVRQLILGEGAGDILRAEPVPFDRE